jgi:hypothetical protein
MDLRIVQQKSQLFLGYLVLKLLFIMVVRLNGAIEMDESLRVNLKYKKKTGLVLQVHLGNVCVYLILLWPRALEST